MSKVVQNSAEVCASLIHVRFLNISQFPNDTFIRGEEFTCFGTVWAVSLMIRSVEGTGKVQVCFDLSMGKETSGNRTITVTCDIHKMNDVNNNLLGVAYRARTSHLFSKNNNTLGYKVFQTWYSPDESGQSESLLSLSDIVLHDHIQLSINMALNESHKAPVATNRFMSCVDETPRNNQSLINCMAELFNDQTSFDITFVCGEARFYAHKLIVSMRSDVFKAMLASGLSESASNEIEISDFEPLVVKIFLQCIYCDFVLPDELDQHCEALMQIAHKYQVLSLISICGRHLVQTLSVTNALVRFELAEAYGASLLRHNCILFMSKNMKELAKQDSTALDCLGIAVMKELVNAL